MCRERDLSTCSRGLLLLLALSLRRQCSLSLLLSWQYFILHLNLWLLSGLGLDGLLDRLRLSRLLLSGLLLLLGLNLLLNRLLLLLLLLNGLLLLLLVLCGIHCYVVSLR